MTPAQKVFIETVIAEFLKKEVINPEIEYQLGLPKNFLRDDVAMQQRIDAAVRTLRATDGRKE